MSFSFDKKELINSLMKNKRIFNRVKELKLTEAQIEQALPILIDMSEEKDDENTKYLTSFYVSHTGSINKMQERSTYWAQYAYLDNLVTGDIQEINFDEDKDFIKEESRRNLVQKLNKYLTGTGKHEKGVYIYGKMGIGKTFLLKRIAKKVAQAGYKIGIINLSDLATKIKNQLSEQVGYEKTLETLKQVDFLFIDDIGAEPITSWFRDEIVFSILNDRMQTKRTTFFTSNYSYAELAKMEARTNKSSYPEYDKSNRLLERIKALTEPYELVGKNKRFM